MWLCLEVCGCLRKEDRSENGAGVRGGGSEREGERGETREELKEKGECQRAKWKKERKEKRRKRRERGTHTRKSQRELRVSKR